MDRRTFDYLQPTMEQIDVMQQMRQAAQAYYNAIDELVPEGPDKTYLIRKLREVAMWVNVTITRTTDGEPRP